jgi:hypothetical protein
MKSLFIKEHCHMSVMDYVIWIHTIILFWWLDYYWSGCSSGKVSQLVSTRVGVQIQGTTSGGCLPRECTVQTL